ncbi:MAG TPA: transglutaminase domain-containing protein [Bacteroidales bacterium]|nr:transglutaminase domain-containing protein [Bacteroidales bacterium]
MKKIYLYWLVILIISTIFFQECRNKSEYNETIKRIAALVEEGALEKAAMIADSLKNATRDDDLRWKADSLNEITKRIRLDFSVTQNGIDTILGKLVHGYSESDRKIWEENGWLEYKIIDGEKRYFNRAATNLILLRNFYQNRQYRDSLTARDPRIVFRKNHTADIIRVSGKSPVPVMPIQIEVTYTITVKPDAVPAGSTIRCWMPYPKENNKRQTEVYLLGISNENYFLLAPDSVVHKTVYMEEKARRGIPTVFQIAFSYFSYGQYFDPENMKILPYDKNSEIYRKYTREQPPHICFTDRVKHLADSLAGNESNPYEIVKRFYYWFNNNIPWAGALEYSIIPNIPEYTLKNRRGDCGMQTFLLMSMLRYKGIPVKWQSGWMVPPQGENLHDWCEVYYEGTGWVPLDISYSLQYSNNQKLKEFYITGIDSYRLIINDDIGGKLYPEKKYLRSEPFDFQRGEVEWEGGNLYFDQWDYDIQVKIKPLPGTRI